MLIGRLLGFLLLTAAALAGGAEIVRSLEAGTWTPLAAGQAWFRFDPGSLNLVQAVTQRHLLPELWDPVAVAILQGPLWLVLLVPGLLLWLAFRPRSSRRRLFRR